MNPLSFLLAIILGKIKYNRTEKVISKSKYLRIRRKWNKRAL